MICGKCGQPIVEGKRFCTHCGAAAPPPEIRHETSSLPEFDHPRAVSHGEFAAVAPSKNLHKAVVVLLSVLALMFLSRFMKGRLPDSKDILPELHRSPIQTPTSQPAFDVRKDAKTVVTVIPRFNYDLAGLVVSYHNSNSWLDISHKRWGDTANIKDLCILWGGDVRDNIQKKFRFRNYDWYCEYFTRDPEAFAIFRSRYFSNNHILATDDRTARAIMGARRGDQVRIRGMLVDYTINGREPPRTTSVSRDDTENGACEIIYVTDFQTLKRSNILWNTLYKACMWLSLLSLAACVYFFVK